MVDTGLALARAYIATGKEEAENLSEKYLNECLVTCQTGYGPQHKKTIEVQDELARLLIRTDRQEVYIYLYLGEGDVVVFMPPQLGMMTGLVCFIVFHATFNNISVISLWSVSLVEENGVPGENHRPVASH